MQRYRLVGMSLALVLSAAAPLWAAASGVGAKLAQEVSVSLTDAAFADAAKALKQASGIVARLEGEAPERRISLQAREVRARDLLDALGALYGLRWRTQTTTIVFYRAPLDRQIDLALKDVDLPTALKALNKAAGLTVRYDGRKPDRRISLQLSATPARNALHALAALFGLAWHGDGAGVALVEPGSTADLRLGEAAQFIARFDELLKGEASTEDATESQLAEQLTPLLRRRLETMEPGETVPFEEFTAEEQKAALQIAQRRVLLSLAESYKNWKSGVGWYAPAAGTGEGVALRMSRSGRQVDLVLPGMDGRAWEVMILTRDGGAPEP